MHDMGSQSIVFILYEKKIHLVLKRCESKLIKVISLKIDSNCKKLET